MLPLLDRVGDWNPQLLREARGRLKPGSLVLAGLVSITLQGLLLIFFWGQLPQFSSLIEGPRHRYCSSGLQTGYQALICIKDAAGNLLINWQLWWTDVFVGLSWASSFLLIVVGVYLLASDLGSEEQRGTLNFVRMSPRSTREILTGKLLGVPLPLYVTLGLALPLQVWAGLNGGVSMGLLLGFDAVTIAASLFFFSAAILVSFSLPRMGGLQAWLSTGFVLVLLVMLNSGKFLDFFPGRWLLMFTPVTLFKFAWDAQRAYEWEALRAWQWMGIPFAENPLSLIAALLLHYGFWIAWIGIALGRRFRSSSTPLLSKPQSYKLVACTELILLGFVDHEGIVASQLYAMLTLNLLGLPILALLLSPSRQSLLDWTRYRRTQPSQPQPQQPQHSLLQDLLGAENSPMLLAMALNVGIVSGILLVWIATWTDSQDQVQGVLAVLLNAGAILVYVAIAQLILASRAAHRGLWAIATLAALIGLAPIAVFLGYLEHRDYVLSHSLWLVSAFPWVAIAGRVAVETVVLVLLGQFSLFTLVSFGAARQLRKMGESETKMLLNAIG
ncbi:hypothetical protein IFO70_09550 [Phormidium tenue FACHB-886]|nr:hypothetical protein [Phormidium tenue FACHB-886]